MRAAVHHALVDALDAPEVEAFVHAGTALCVSGLTAAGIAMVAALVQAIWKEQRRGDEIAIFSNVNGLSGSLPGLL